MKIGVKYCGGCNPEYRREEVEEVLRKHFKISYSEDVDILILINGCRKACLAEEVEHPNILVVGSPMSEEEIVRKVEDAMKELGKAKPQSAANCKPQEAKQKKLNINTPKKS